MILKTEVHKRIWSIALGSYQSSWDDRPTTKHLSRKVILKSLNYDTIPNFMVEWFVLTVSYQWGPGFDSQPEGGNLEVFHEFSQTLRGKLWYSTFSRPSATSTSLPVHRPLSSSHFMMQGDFWSAHATRSLSKYCGACAVFAGFPSNYSLFIVYTSISSFIL
jgi:hypothetical protein